MCGTKACTCKIPDVCDDDLTGTSGEILVDIQVTNGLLSFIPPPGRATLPTTSLAFMTNISLVDFRYGGPVVVCTDQIICSQNVSRLMMRTPLLVLQSALEEGYLSYRGKPHFNGFDLLSVWVNDQGYTDECYNNSLTAIQTVDIRVVGINDPPQLIIPTVVLVYPSDLRCYVNFNEIKTNDQGLLESCRSDIGASSVPPSSANAQPLFVTDVDINEVPYGNMTLMLTVGLNFVTQSSAGTFFLPSILENSTAWYEQYYLGGLSTTVLYGKLEEIDHLLQSLVYDGDPNYIGYLPFVIFANDNFNYGQCSGYHVCGYHDPVCYDPSTAEDHLPVNTGTARAILDVMIGAPSVCASLTCDACNSEVGCGWCPGNCPEQGGTCLVGSSSGPLYEVCNTDNTGRGWQQCQAVSFDILGLVKVVVGVLGGGVLLFLLVGRWIQRRHGTLKAYTFKLLRNFTLTARKLHLLPPKKANYTQFLFSIFIAIVVVVILQLPVFKTTEPTCVFVSKFLLDGRTTNVDMVLDNCQVNMLPTSLMQYPESELQSILIKFAFISDPLIDLEVSTCSSNKTFTLTNNRADSVKYIGFYCNIEIVVPDTQYVVPDMTISASGTNMTTVRTFPTSFALNFGPNTLTLNGNTLNADIQNIQSKNFVYNVVHGRLKAINLQVTQEAIFSSEDADMTVTTPIQTSVRFWQKSANLVCLTAAPGSLYVDNSCEQVCTFITPNSSSTSSTSSRRSDDELMHPFDRMIFNHSLQIDRSHRILGATTMTVYGLVIEDPVAGDPRTPVLCSGDPAVDANWLCKPYDPVALALEEPCPVGTKYSFKKDVPQIEGCTNLEFCVVTESLQCLCKPACDMNRALNPPGQCNTIGQCCQTICAGYSRADMFPDPDQPRCPPSGQYCNGTLAQQFTFTSTSGQVALQVLPTCLPDANNSDQIPFICTDYVNSYQGQAPTSGEVATNADILAADKKVLDQVFHVGGSPAPRQGWFAIRTSGPGVTDSDNGQFVWVDSIRELVLAPWALQLFSFGLFQLEMGASSTRFNPGFCPAFINTDSSTYQTRLIEVRDAIVQTLQSGGYTIPSSSLLAFVPLTGPPLIFLTDIVNNVVTASELRTSDYPMLLSIFGFVLAIPLLASIIMCIVLLRQFRYYLIDFRRRLCNLEWASRQFSAALVPNEKKDNIADVPIEIIDQVRGRTGFYYLLEHNLSLSTDKTLAITEQFSAVAYEMVFTIFPTIFVFLFADNLSLLYQTSRCSYRVDLCTCLSEVDGYLQFAMAMKTLIYVYLITAMVEMAFHFLAVQYNILKRILRLFFYVLLFMMIWQSIVIILLILVSVVVDFVVNPLTSAIYTFTVAETVAILLSIIAKMYRYQLRVRSNVEELVKKYQKQKAKMLPKKLVDIVIGTHIDKALRDNGFDVLSIFKRLLLATIAIAISCFFLFMGFITFTDMTLVYTSMINTGILSASLLIIYLSFVGEGDEHEVEHDSQVLGEEISKSLHSILDMLERQTMVAVKLLNASGMGSGLEQYEDGE